MATVGWCSCPVMVLECEGYAVQELPFLYRTPPMVVQGARIKQVTMCCSGGTEFPSPAATSPGSYVASSSLHLLHSKPLCSRQRACTPQPKHFSAVGFRRHPATPQVTLVLNAQNGGVMWWVVV